MIQEYFEKRCSMQTDINEHLPTLKGYVNRGDHVTEFGFRGGESTCAFLAGKPKKLITYDFMDRSGTFNKLNALVGDETEFVFKCADTRKVRIESTDLLFIDTLHSYVQAIEELKQADRVKKYIILHDTEIFATVGEGGGKGLSLAIIEFLRRVKKWELHHHHSNNNGLTILKRRWVNE
jgi:hypothetical protein